MCGTCVRHIQHKANITRPLHTWQTCSAIKMCFFTASLWKKKWPSLTTLNCHTVSHPQAVYVLHQRKRKCTQPNNSSTLYFLCLETYGIYSLINWRGGIKLWKSTHHSPVCVSQAWKFLERGVMGGRGVFGCKLTLYSSSTPVPAVSHSGVPRNFVRGGRGSTNTVENRGQRERGSGGGSSLVRGSGGSCNLVQEISFHIVKFS